MKRGDIVFVELPRPRRPGHEQIGARPAVIVQADLSAAPNTMVVIIPATSNLAALRFSYVVQVFPDEMNGLEKTSLFLVSQIRALDKARIQRVVGSLSEDDMRSIKRELEKLLGLEEE